MSIYLSCAVAWLLYGLTRSYARSLKQTSTARQWSVKYLIQSAFCGYAKKFFLVASVVYTVLVALIMIVNQAGGTGTRPGLAGPLLNVLLWFDGFHKVLDGDWKWVGIGALVIFLFAIAYRVIKTDVRQLAAELVEKYNSGELEDMEDTEELKKIRSAIYKLRQQLEQLNRVEPKGLQQFQAQEVQKDKIRKEIKVQEDAFLHADFLRRLALEIDRAAKVSSRGFMGELRRFFASAGMYTTVQKTETMVSTAGSVLLFISLMTMPVSQVGPATGEVRYSLENVLVGKHIRELDDKWKAQFGKPSPTQTTDQEEQKVIASFARRVETQVVASFMRDSIQVAPAQQYHFVSNIVRHSVLSRYVEAKHKAGDPHEYSVSQPFEDLEKYGLEQPASGMAREYEYQATRSGPQTGFGKKMEEDLSAAARTMDKAERKTFIRKMQDYVKSFGEPVSFSDVISMTYENLFDHAVGEPAKDLFKTMFGSEEIFSKFGAGNFSKAFRKFLTITWR